MRFLWFSRKKKSTCNHCITISFGDNQASVTIRCSLEELVKAQKILEDVYKEEVKSCSSDQLAQIANLRRSLQLIRKRN